MKQIETVEITLETLQELREIILDMNNEINKIDNAKNYSRVDFSNTLTYYQEWLQRLLGISDYGVTKDGKRIGKILRENEEE